MRTRSGFILAAVASLANEWAHAAVPASWTTNIDPFRIADNLYYVGSQDLASYLVVTAAGNILINANLASSPAQIRANVEKLGYRWNDTRILLISQAHSDHVGGAATILPETRAAYMVMDGDVEVVESGGRADFAPPSPPGKTLFAPTRVDRVLHDGDTVSLGGVILIAHKTAGHTRGCTTWTMRAHLPGEPAGTLRDIVIVGGTSVLDDYRLAGASRPPSYPGIAEDYKRTFATLRTLPCEVFLGAHGGYFDLLAKLKSYPQTGPKVFIDPQGYRRFVAEAEGEFEAELAKQRVAAGGS